MNTHIVKREINNKIDTDIRMRDKYVIDMLFLHYYFDYKIGK